MFSSRTVYGLKRLHLSGRGRRSRLLLHPRQSSNVFDQLECGTKGSACNAASAASMSTKPRWEACSNMPSLNFHAKYSVNVLGDVYRNLKTSGRPSHQGIGVE